MNGRITFAGNPWPEGQKVHWTGKIARAYVGSYEFDHDFTAVATLPVE